MITIQVDYRNMQFMIRKNGKYTMDNPLPVEVQRAVIEQVIHDFVKKLRCRMKEQPLTDIDVFRQ